MTSTPFNTKASVDYYLSQNVSSSKVVVGIPAYGRSFEQTRSIGSSFNGVGNGTWAPGVYDYKSLPRVGATEIIDKAIGASYSWDFETEEIISYDNTEVALQKAHWIKDYKLRGAAFWESSGDKAGNQSLISAVASILCLKNDTNLLDYSNSSYSNLQSGMPLMGEICSKTTNLETRPASKLSQAGIAKASSAAVPEDDWKSSTIEDTTSMPGTQTIAIFSTSTKPIITFTSTEYRNTTTAASVLIEVASICTSSVCTRPMNTSSIPNLSTLLTYQSGLNRSTTIATNVIKATSIRTRPTSTSSILTLSTSLTNQKSSSIRPSMTAMPASSTLIEATLLPSSVVAVSTPVTSPDTCKPVTCGSSSIIPTSFRQTFNGQVSYCATGINSMGFCILGTFPCPKAKSCIRSSDCIDSQVCVVKTCCGEKGFCLPLVNGGCI